MRMYNFAPYYLSSIQQGIQAAHSQVKLVHKYSNESEVIHWVNNPVTICLNAGNSASLHELVSFMKCETGTETENSENHFIKFATFNEDNESLEGIMTNVAILVPERVYNAYNKLVDNYYNNGALIFDAEIMFSSVSSFLEGYNSIKSARIAYEEYVDKYGELSTFEAKLADKLRSYKLAT